MGLVTMIGQALALGGLTGARPFLTLGLLSLYARYTLGPREDLWATSEYAIAIFAALAVLEHLMRTDADIEELMRIPFRVLSAASGAVAVSILVALGEDPGAWDNIGHTPPPTAAPELSGWSGVSVMAVAGAGAVGVQEARRRSLSAMRDLAMPDSWVRWLEAGGVVGVVAAVLLAPFIALFLLIALTALAAFAGLSLRAALTKLDASQREACASCGHMLRMEALRCPQCGSERAPETLLD